jgi:hypothetical protein
MSRLIFLLLIIVFGALASQAPEYAQQYRQRLGGAVEELRILIEDFNKAAATEGLTTEQALKSYDAAGGSFLPKRGEQLRDMFRRYDVLSEQLQHFESADPITQIQFATFEADARVAEGTLAHFEPAVPLTLAGALSTVAGVGFGIITYTGGSLAMRKRRRKKHANQRIYRA